MALKPIVFVPGFPASELKQKSKKRTLFPPSVEELLDSGRRKALIRLLAGPDDPPGDIVAGEPIRGVLSIAKQAQSLYDILRESQYGYTTQDGTLLAPIGWDWRGPVDAGPVQRDVAGAIERLAEQHGRKVVVIVHSTGGLVLRALLAVRPELAGSIEQILAFGIPWAGTLKAVRFLAKGEVFGLAFAGKRLVGLSAAEVREVMSHCQAAYDLFPPDPRRTVLKGPDDRNLNLFVGPGGAQIGPLVETSWIPPGPSKDFMREMAARADRRLGERTSTIELPDGTELPITNVVGWGAATDTRCTLAADGSLTFESTPEGDGTVARVSAGWLRGRKVRTLLLPIGVFPTAGIPSVHSRIWDAPPVRQIFNEVLLDVERSPFVCGAVDGDQAIDPSGPFTVRLVASDAAGRPLPGAKVTFKGLPGRTTVAFGSSVRKEVVFQRTGLRANAGSDLFRFGADVRWGGAGPGERRDVPLLIRV